MTCCLVVLICLWFGFVWVFSICFSSCYLFVNFVLMGVFVFSIGFWCMVCCGFYA